MNDYATIHQPVLLERCVELVAPALDHDGAVAVGTAPWDWPDIPSRSSRPRPGRV